MLKSVTNDDFATVTRILETLQPPTSESALDTRLYLALRAPLIAFRGLMLPGATSTSNLSLSSILPDDLPSNPTTIEVGGSGGSDSGGFGDFFSVLGD